MKFLLSISVLLIWLLSAGSAWSLTAKVSAATDQANSLINPEPDISLTLDSGKSMNVDMTVHDSTFTELGKVIQTACVQAGADVQLHQVQQKSTDNRSRPLIMIHINSQKPQLLRIGHLMMLALERAGLHVITD